MVPGPTTMGAGSSVTGTDSSVGPPQASANERRQKSARYFIDSSCETDSLADPVMLISFNHVLNREEREERKDVAKIISNP